MSTPHALEIELPAPKVARRQGFGGLALTLALAAASLAAWQAFAAPHIPPPVMHPERYDGDVYWIAPGVGPFYSHGDVQGADLLVVGDSRAFDDIELETLRSAGFGGVARVWGPNADIADLLPSITARAGRAVLILASPSLFGADYDPLMTVLLEAPPPDLEALSLANGIARWKVTERERLMTGAPPAGDPAREFFLLKVDGLIDVWAQRLTDTVQRSGWSTNEVDRVLNEWVDRRRALWLATFTTQKWHKQWSEPIEPDKLAAPTRTMLKTRDAEQRAATRARLAEALRALAAGGVRLAAVRAPIGAGVLAVEREFVTDEDLRAFFADLGVPYFEHQALSLTLRDGSHLTWRASIEYTRLVADLLAGLGWGR